MKEQGEHKASPPEKAPPGDPDDPSFRNPLKHPLFISSVLVYAVLLVMKKTGVYVPFISDYLADFLVMPVVLSVAMFGVRRTGEGRTQYRFAWWHVAGAVVLYGFLFEWAFPMITDRFTADPWDLLAYAAGGVLFFFGMNR